MMSMIKYEHVMRTRLESVKTDMAEVEIDEEDVQKEMEKECYEVEVLP